MEHVGLAVLAGKRFEAGGDVTRPRQPIIKKGEKNVRICKEIPPASLLVMAMTFGSVVSLAIATDLLPPEVSQLGALSSSLAAIVLVLVEGRKGGLRELLGRFLIWRVGLQWWVITLFFAVIPSVAALYLFDLLGGPPVDWSELPPLYTVVPMFIILTIAAGIGEEFGWRGFLLPRLQTRQNALVSSLIIGVMWVVCWLRGLPIARSLQSEIHSRARHRNKMLFELRKYT